MYLINSPHGVRSRLSNRKTKEYEFNKSILGYRDYVLCSRINIL